MKAALVDEASNQLNFELTLARIQPSIVSIWNQRWLEPPRLNPNRTNPNPTKPRLNPPRSANFPRLCRN